MSHVVDKHLTNISAALRPPGLTTSMWRALNGLSEGEPSTIGDIADHTAFERSYVSRLVARMADLGLAETIGDQTDCRRLHRSVVWRAPPGSPGTKVLGVCVTDNIDHKYSVLLLLI
jgi:DNA-binding MarR family transcriptional regulator